MTVRPVAEQTEVPGTEREVDQRLENAIRNIKSKNESVTEARNEKKKADDRGQELLKEKELPFYVSEKQRFKLVATTKDGVKLEHWEPPTPGKPDAPAKANGKRPDGDF